MSAYPDFPQEVTSTKSTVNTIDASRATNGLLRVRSFISSPPVDFSIVHIVDTVNKDALMTHYYDNLGTVFELHWRAEDEYYDVAYVAAPKVTAIGGTFWTVTNSMGGV